MIGAYASTFVVAFCSLLYEFILAQTASSVLGSSVMQYNLTIGLFVGGLGLGSLACDHIITNVALRKLFVWIELALSVLGALAPFAILAVDALGSHSSAGSVYLVTYAFVFLIGALSGFELPLLMQIAESTQPQTSNNVLAVDYFGMVAAAVVFPFVILPHMNLFQVALCIGAANAVLALGWSIQGKFHSDSYFGLIVVMGFFLLLCFHDSLTKTVIEEFYFVE